MTAVYEDLVDRFGNEVAKSCIAVFKDTPGAEDGSVVVPSCDDILSHEDYYVSRLLHIYGVDFAVVTYRAMEEIARRSFPTIALADAMKFLLCTYPTAREQMHLIMDPRAFCVARMRYDAVPPYCSDYCTCYKHYDWSPPKGSVKDASSGSMTPDASEAPSERPTSPSLPITNTAADERELEEFLARANLSHLYAALRGAQMWVDLLRAIPLGQLHSELMVLVPHRAHRQRLIDAMHSTIDIRASHKEKQGMWYRARDEGRTVYVRGIEGLTDYELREYLNRAHGEVVDMRYMFDPRNNSFLGYGFVMFLRKDAVDSILRRTSYALRDGVTICVKCSDELQR